MHMCNGPSNSGVTYSTLTAPISGFSFYFFLQTHVNSLIMVWSFRMPTFVSEILAKTVIERDFMVAHVDSRGRQLIRLSQRRVATSSRLSIAKEAQGLAPQMQAGTYDGHVGLDQRQEGECSLSPSACSLDNACGAYRAQWPEHSVQKQ